MEIPRNLLVVSSDLVESLNRRQVIINEVKVNKNTTMVKSVAFFREQQDEDLALKNGSSLIVLKTSRWLLLLRIVNDVPCKIIIERIKNALGKIVGLNQNAFVPNRHIQDNILLSRELLRGYDKKEGPNRVAMKINIQKAYDTINWQFLEAFLKDDLLMFCHRDIVYVSVVKEVIEYFGVISSNLPDYNKSSIIFGSISIEDKQCILDSVPFKVEKLFVKYLGVPLTSKRIGVKNYKSLIDKVKSRVSNWKNKCLSYAGSLQLIAYVLESTHMYCASVFLRPYGVIKDINKILK
ncbi:RNA-directed DNA polymerase, eukaryota, reverse transcriptase zinc-binding domain protein [Tanacetum coccineum]